MTSCTPHRYLVAVLLCGLACSTAERAHAQDRDKAAAEALFDEGRKLMAAGNYAAACSKLEASQALDAGVGTQLNLADCYEKLGKTASAWAQFRETITAAHNTGSFERERTARKRAEALEPQLSYLTVLAPHDKDLTLTRDATRLDPAAIGSALPVDPGHYVITASAPGKQGWSTTVTVAAASDHVSVNVPPLEPVAAEVPLVTDSPQPNTPQLSAAPVSPELQPPAQTQKWIGMIASGTGVAVLVVSGYFGLQAASRWSDAKSSCDPYPYCGENGQHMAEDAQRSATISTITTIAGGVLLAGGLVLWLSAPGQPRRQETALLVGPGSLQLRGSFQ